MGAEAIALLACLLLRSAAAERHTSGVFLDKQDALAVMSRHKRAGPNSQEARPQPNLERECIEEVCHYEEAREIFQDTYRTDIFWSVYVDGDQCATKPCKNGALCSDSVGGYDCICKSGFSGVHCETDQTVCVLDATKGCSQFCKPGYQSYECSCARGWKLQEKQKEKCVPAVSFPCGKVNSLSQWESRRSTNIQSNYEGLSCSSGECPWQALLQSDVGLFCNGVILKENLVLTTAECATRYSSFQVVVGKRTTSFEEEEQVLYTKTVHVHPRYVAGRPDNDLAAVELRNHITFRKAVTAACLPERDFAENVLMTGEWDAVITGWKDGSQPLVLEGSLTLNHLTYEPLSQCAERHQGLVTNKMFCTAPRPKADCTFAPGSPALTLYREVYFLTGVVSRPHHHNCGQGYVFQKISRFLPWLNRLMDSK